MDNTNTSQPVPLTPPVTPPATPPAVQPPPPVSGDGTSSTKLLIVVLVVVVILVSGIGAVLLYKQMNMTRKAPATNYAIETTPTVVPTAAGPTVPPVLSQPVAEDAGGIDKEIQILDETLSGTDSASIKTQDIEDVTK